MSTFRVFRTQHPTKPQEPGVLRLCYSLLPGWGSPSHQSPNTVWSTHSHAALDAHRQHVVVEALGLQASDLPSQLDLLPLEALQAKEGQGRL